jgi:hypothetical protein
MMRESDPASILRCALPDSSAIYCSVPLTTGKRLLNFIQAHAADKDFGISEDVLRRRVYEPNKRSARLFAHALHKEYGNRVIDPSRFPSLKHWSQSQYNQLWGRIILEYCDAVVFADDWQYSNGCAAEFLVCSRAKIAAKDSRGELITPEKAETLISSAIEELSIIGCDTSHLQQSLSLLQQPDRAAFPVSDPVLLTDREQRRVCLSLWRCLVEPHAAVLVSSPPPEKNKSAPAISIDTFRKHFAAIVIDRTRFTPKEWSERSQRLLWRSVILGYVNVLVLAGSWQYSAACLSDLYWALHAKVSVLDEHLRTLSGSEALKSISEALDLGKPEAMVTDQNELRKAMVRLRDVA